MIKLMFFCGVMFLFGGCASTKEIEHTPQSTPLLGIEDGMTPDEVAANLPMEAQVISGVDDADMGLMTIALNGKKQHLWFPNGQLAGAKRQSEEKVKGKSHSKPR